MRLIAALSFLGLVACGPTLPPAPPVQPSRGAIHFDDPPADAPLETQDTTGNPPVSLNTTDESPAPLDVTSPNPNPPIRIYVHVSEETAQSGATTDPHLRACEELARTDAPQSSQFSVSFATDRSDTDATRAMRRRQLFEACVANTIGMVTAPVGGASVAIVPSEPLTR